MFHPDRKMAGALSQRRQTDRMGQPILKIKDLVMVIGDTVTSICLLALGGIVVGAGLWHLDREDRRRVESIRQHCCQWHYWQASEERVWLVCRLCGKRSRRLNPREDRAPETVHLFP